MPERSVSRLLCLGLALLALAAGCASRTDTGNAGPVQDQSASMARAPGYRLRPGDLIEVSFPTIPEERHETPVTPDGTVTLPMVGEVVAAGATPGELAQAISERMAPYLVDPTVSVILKQIALQPVFVIGEVNKPGRVSSASVITVSMALAEAGGVKPSGRPSSVVVVRTYGVDQPQAYRVDVTKVLSGRDLSEDMQLIPNDVVYVPASLIGKIDEFVDLFFDQVAPAQLFYLRGYDMMHLQGAEWRW